MSGMEPFSTCMTSRCNWKHVICDYGPANRAVNLGFGIDVLRGVTNSMFGILVDVRELPEGGQTVVKTISRRKLTKKVEMGLKWSQMYF